MIITGACIAGAVSGVGTSIVMQSLKHSQSAIDNSSDYESEMRRNLEITEGLSSRLYYLKHFSL
jgi:predicted subunit of tRNA(5-methylaminomethyl-2-thiouridylate) methyltransferase